MTIALDVIKVYLLSLGCAKNTVDSQVMSGALQDNGFVLTDDPAAAQVIVINTCGFIEAAKQESIAAILELAQWKQEGNCRLLLAVGCLAEKYGDELLSSLPELDGVMGSGDYTAVAALLDDKLGRPSRPAAPPRRDLPAGEATAYLKIAEGCDNCCAYCLIPQLRGPLRSRPLPEIEAEARQLLAAGVTELVLIAQDTTAYGLDIYGEPRLPQLLAGLAQLPFSMIRLLYAYPHRVSDELVRVMAAHKNICHYLDMPIQHGSDRILAAMGRQGRKEDIISAVDRLRAAMPDIALRTTIMTGFPGESEVDVEELANLLKRCGFLWVGGFAYSREEDTPAALMPHQVEEEEKQRRLDLLLAQAAGETAQQLSAWKDRTLTVLAEGEAPEQGENMYRGRSQYQAPEVDGAVYFHSSTPIVSGQLYQVLITSNDIYDLWGVAQ